MLTLPPTGSVTLGQLLGLSEPWIPVCKKVKLLSHVRLFATPWTVAYQAPLSVGFSRQGCWSGVPFSKNSVLCGTSTTLPFLEAPYPLSFLNFENKILKPFCTLKNL